MKLRVVLLIALLVTGCGGSESGVGDRTSVGVVIKGLDNPYFAAMEQGVRRAGRQPDTDVRLSAATSLADTSGQAAKLEALVAEDLDCYVVNPISQSNLIRALSHAPPGTPIVNVDSPVGSAEARALGVEMSTYIGTDNQAAGKLAAATMAKFVGRDARVGLIGGISGDATSTKRIAGFRAGARGRFEMLPPVSADWNEHKARRAAAALLRQNRGIDGFFAANDQMALGVAGAVAEAGRRGKVAVVGLDGIQQALEAVESGAMSATVSQYPYTIGRLGVEACLAAASDEPLPRNVNAPVQVVTRDNVRRAEENFPQPVEPFKSPFR
jgi:ABC-type sugar transport system substrate-binding protein